MHLHREVQLPHRLKICYHKSSRYTYTQGKPQRPKRLGYSQNLKEFIEGVLKKCSTSKPHLLD